jgi:DNA-binding SARP family transcriptional activator
VPDPAASSGSESLSVSSTERFPGAWNNRKEHPNLKTPAVGRQHHDDLAVDTLDGRDKVAVRLLGGFELRIDGQRVDVVERCQKVIACVALSPGSQDRSVLAARLWPDSNEDRAGANLRATRWREPVHGTSRVTRVHGNSVLLCDDVRVDARELERVGWSLLHGERPAEDFDRSLLFLDLLPGWYDDWVIAERDRLAQLQLRFAEAYGCHLLHAGSIIEAMDVALRLVATDPYRESSHRLLAATYLLDGSPHQAEAQIDRHRRQMLTDLGHRTQLSMPAVYEWLEATNSRSGVAANG